MPDSERQQMVWAALDRHPVCMVTTAADGTLKTRPMSGHVDRENHRILFLTHRHTGIMDEVLRSPGVSISLSEEDRNFHAAITCTAAAIEDRQLITAIWTPMTGAWFPGGPDDPDVMLLSLTPTSAEIWDGPSSGVLVAFKLATAKILGRQADLGVNATIDMR